VTPVESRTSFNPWSFSDWVKQSPEHPAIYSEPDGLLSRAKLSTLILRQREQLLAALRPVDRLASSQVVVAARVTATLQSVVLLLACWELGLAVAPLHSRLPKLQLESILNRIAQRAVLLDLTTESPRVRGTGGSPRLPEETAAIVFTSGSSAEPKGVVLTRRSFNAAVAASAQHLGTNVADRWLLALPPAHVGGLSVVVRCLLSGLALIVLPESSSDSLRLDSILQQRVTLASCVPTQLDRWLRAGFCGAPSLRALLVGGAACPADWLELAWQRGIPALPTYGATETCAQIATLRLDRRGKDIGLCALPGLELRLQEGELMVRGPTVASEYLEGQPLRDAEGWYGTGDLAQQESDGTWTVVGRRDQVIITGGEKVSPERVESALLKIAGLGTAAVTSVPDPQWGTCVVVVVEGACPPLGVLRNLLREVLAPWELPRQLLRVGSLPRTEAGKLRRGALSMLVRDGGQAVERE
jgi:O-succinylbenzoic acid--CoA ligase